MKNGAMEIRLGQDENHRAVEVIVRSAFYGAHYSGAHDE